MRKIMMLALAMTPAVVVSGVAIGQGVVNSTAVSTGTFNAAIVVGSTSGIVIPQLFAGAEGAVYHQAVDVYYDRDGNKLATTSATHAIDFNCQPGRRQQQEDLLVQDDGKGNVRFVSARLPSEPATGVKPVTAEAKAKAIMAIRETQALPPTQLAAAQ